MKLNWLPTCLQCYLTELFLENDFICWCHFITYMIVYTYAEFGMNCLKNKLNTTHCSECCIGSLLQYHWCRVWFCIMPSYSKRIKIRNWFNAEPLKWKLHGKTKVRKLLYTVWWLNTENVLISCNLYWWSWDVSTRQYWMRFKYWWYSPYAFVICRWHGYSCQDSRRSADKSRYITYVLFKLGLEVNTTNTKIVVFRKRGHLVRNERWMYNGVAIELVEHSNHPKVRW